ncbi:MAG: YfhO family protein [Actinomycetota bacterium]
MGRLAGPALIVTAVIAISWDTAVAGLISRQHLDIPAFWVPTHCYLGQSLREGTIPAWNPFVFTGTPFAADPQSGWMFLLPMLMYTVLPCDVAAPLLFLLTPMIGGLGLYLFLRSEGLSRVAGTIGGLVLSLSLAGSKLGLSFPFVSTLAWTAAALWAASCLLRASTWSSRILWTLATAALWGQIVSAHGSQGQLVGTATLAAFLLARTVSDVVRRRRGPGVALALGALLIASVVAVNLATLVPRATVFPRTATSLGNETLDRLTREAADGEGKAVPYKEGRGADPAWPAKLLLPQGAYVGLAVLGLVALAPWTRRHRALALAMGAYGLTAYALSLQDVADAIGERAGGGVALDVLYLHQPWRLAIALVPAVAVLAAVGIDAWSERALEARLAMLGAAGVLVGVTCAWLPDAGSLAPGLLVAGGATLLLLASLRVPLVLAGVAVLVALELSSNVLTGYGLDSQEMLRSNDFGLGLLPPGMTALAGPNLDAGAYLRPPRFVQELGGAADPVRFNVAGPFHDGMMKEENWAAIAEQRSMLFRVEGADGYNPFQLRRFWLYSRHVNTQAQKYNVTSFPDAAAPVLDALGVTHVISPADASPPPDRSPVSTDGRWVLYARSAAAPRAQLFPSWTVVGSADDALDAVTEPGFDPVRTLVLEEDPRVASDPGRETAGTAAYRWDGTQAATIEVNAESPSVLLIRNAYDTAWRATVDGRPVPVLAADSISMGVAVPAGPHTVRLEYRESSIAVGLLGTFTAIVALVSSALWLLRRERRAAPPTVEPEPSHADDSPTTAR